MKKLVLSLASIGLALGIAGGAFAQEEEHSETPHYPIHKPKNVDWTFDGPFGTYDKGQLQRGLKVYTQVCSACHSLDLVSFRTLTDLGYSEDQVASLAAQYDVEDGPDDTGEMFMRPATPSDYFPSPFANPEAAAASNGGAAPPDLSLMAQARSAQRGFPLFVADIVTQYQEGGPDYIYSLLTGYEEPPEGMEVPQGSHYNPYFMNAASLAMAPPLSDGIVTYDDGAPETVDQYAHDVSAFLMWTAEPHLEDRKSLGLKVMVFLLVFSILLYLVKRTIWSRIEH